MIGVLQRIIPRGSWLVAILWLCLAYTLSVGPAFYVARQTGIGRQWARSFYAPLFWLRDNTSVDTPLNWCSDRWEKADPSEAARQSRRRCREEGRDRA
jgi:hypothetical protein